MFATSSHLWHDMLMTGMVFGADKLRVGLHDYSLADIVPKFAKFVPIDEKTVAVVLHTNKPVDGDLFCVKWRGERLFRRITRTDGLITLVSKTRRVIVPKDTENELEIEGRVMFVISFPNCPSDETLTIMKGLICDLRRA